MLTQEEKWHLDLLGYFVVRNCRTESRCRINEGTDVRVVRMERDRFQAAHANQHARRQAVVGL